MAQATVTGSTEEASGSDTLPPAAGTTATTTTETEQEPQNDVGKLFFNKSLLVEKIVDVSFSKDGNRLYRVQWEETWETEEDLLNASKDLLRDYWENHLVAHVPLEKQQTTVEFNDDITSESTSPGPKKTMKMENATKETSPANSYLTSTHTTNGTVATSAEKAKELVTDIPDQYKNVGFAKSVREQFSKEVPDNNNFDFIEDFIAKRNEPKKRVTGEKRSREDMIREYISYRNGTRVICELCGESFADKKSLLRHKICRHEKFSPHQCSICRKMFVKPGDVRRHMATHSDVRTHYCCFCSKAYKTKNHLQRHIKAKHSDEGFSMSNDSDGLDKIMTTDISEALANSIMTLTPSDTSIINIVQQDGVGNILTPIHDEINNPNDTVLHPVAINANAVLLQDTNTVLHNANVILHNHPGLGESFMTTRSDGVQMCLIDRDFF